MAEITVYYEGPIVTRAEAKAVGLHRFFTGKPCRRGHVAQRNYSKGECVKCLAMREAGEKRRAQLRAFDRQRNATPKRRAYKLALSRSEKQKAKALAKRSTPEAKAAKKAYNQSEAFLASRDKYFATEKGRSTARRCLEAARARLRGASGVFTAEDEAKLRAAQKRRHICNKRFTKANPAELDHVIALADGGSHDASNIALAHRSCNAQKGARRTHLI